MTFPSGADPEKDQKILELLTKCEGFLQSKSFDEAINGCRAVLDLSPENLRAKELMEEAQSRLEAELFTRENLRKAKEFFSARDFQKCVNECQKIQLLDPDHAEANALLVKAQARLEAEPFVQNFVQSGKVLFESGLYDEAIAQWEKVKAIDPDYPDLDRLMNNAQHMMSSIPPEPFAGEERMFELEETSFSEEPAHEQEEAREAPETEGFGFVSDQERISQLLDEGQRLFNNEQYQSAIEVWSEIFMLDVNHQDALEKIEGARAEIQQQRVRLKDKFSEAQSAYEGGEIDKARQLFQQVTAIDPENVEARKYLEQLEKSEAPLSLEDLVAKGEDAESKGDYREAAQYFSQALAVDTENTQLADRIKNLNLLAKKQEQAKVLMGNARAFRAEGKVDSARHALGKILETDPENQEALDMLRELKEAAPASVSAAAIRGVPAPRKTFPVSPVLIVFAIVLIVGVGGYFYFFAGESSEDTSPIETPVPKKPVGTAPTAANPAVPAQASPGTAQPGGPGAAKAPGVEEGPHAVPMREAEFYFREKRYDEAMKKVQEVLKEDPANKDAISLRLRIKQTLDEIRASEEKLLEDANQYFSYSEFAGAVKLYEKYLEGHPETRQEIQPQILKCYYNLGVLAIREWRCDTAADYFRQVLFIDETDRMSREALEVARRCQKSGTTDIEVRKAVALMDMRR